MGEDLFAKPYQPHSYLIRTPQPHPIPTIITPSKPLSNSIVTPHPFILPPTHTHTSPLKPPAHPSHHLPSPNPHSCITFNMHPMMICTQLGRSMKHTHMHTQWFVLWTDVLLTSVLIVDLVRLLEELEEVVNVTHRHG